MTEHVSRTPGLAPSAALWAVLGAVSAAVAVLIGAFGAHALRGKIAPDMLAALETGVRQQMLHAVALIAVAWASDRSPARSITAAGWCFALGTVLFSGSLYGLALSGMRALGLLTPIGGLALIGGWLLLALGLWRAKARS